jgi:hypothetical protein
MKALKPGMKAPAGGIYIALHGNSHRLEHELTISEGTIFPVCRHCGHRVRFTLARLAHNVEQGWVPFGELFEPYHGASRDKLLARAA